MTRSSRSVLNHAARARRVSLRMFRDLCEAGDVSLAMAVALERAILDEGVRIVGIGPGRWSVLVPEEYDRAPLAAAGFVSAPSPWRRRMAIPGMRLVVRSRGHYAEWLAA